MARRSGTVASDVAECGPFQLRASKLSVPSLAARLQVGGQPGAQSSAVSLPNTVHRLQAVIEYLSSTVRTALENSLFRGNC